MGATVNTGWCKSFIQDLTSSVHDFFTDDIRLALYPDDKNLDASNIEYYISDGELSSPGYTAGGVSIEAVVKRNAGIIGLKIDPILWARIKGEPRSGILYNSSIENKAIAVLDFYKARSVDGGFQIISSDMPPYMGFVERIR